MTSRSLLVAALYAALGAAPAGAASRTVHSPASLMVFTDEFNDGVVDQSVWHPIGNAVLTESNGQLVVTRMPGTTGEFGVRFVNPFPAPPPITESALQKDRSIGHVTLLKRSDQAGARPADAAFLNVMQVAPDGRHLDSTVVNLATGENTYFDRDAFGALRMRSGLTSSTGTPYDSVEIVANRTYTLIPPACKGDKCDYGFDCCPVLIVAKWRIGASAARGGGTNLDPNVGTTVYGGTAWTTSSADTFRLSRYEFQCGTDVPSVDWSLSPNFVRIGGGQVVTVHAAGGGLLALGTPTVTVSGVPAAGAAVLNDSTMQFVAPPGKAFGLAEVVVRSGSGFIESVLDEDLTYYVTATPLQLNTMSPPFKAVAGSPFSGTIELSSQGAGGVTFARASGALPPGITLSSTGVLSGTCDQPGIYAFHVVATDAIGQQAVRFVWFEVQPITAVFPGTGSALALVTPNPSHGIAHIAYRLIGDAAVRLDVVDAAGRIVRTIVDRRESTGDHYVIWDGLDTRGDRAPAGTYFYRLSVNGRSEVRRAVVLR
jgi:hypothetical protein